MTFDKTRLIGRKEIQPVFDRLYGITTWPSVMAYIKRNNFPFHRIGQGYAEKPLIFTHELIEYELKQGRKVSINDIIIS
jgi:hypothetical protein